MTDPVVSMLGVDGCSPMRPDGYVGCHRGPPSPPGSTYSGERGSPTRRGEARQARDKFLPDWSTRMENIGVQPPGWAVAEAASRLDEDASWEQVRKLAWELVQQDEA